MPLSGRVPTVPASPMLLTHWYSRRVAMSRVTAHSTPPANTGKRQCRVRYGNAGRSVVAFGVSAPNHAAQTGVDVQIVSDRVTQFSGQLNALSFESTVVNAAFICHTAQPVITHFETEVRVNLVTTKRTSTKLIVTGRTVVVLETVTVETGVVILGPTQFTTCIPVLSFGAACATVAKPASATAIAIAVFFIFCASLSSKIRHEVTKDLTVKSFTGA